jgi:L-histidine Nalpha-methyltransferase
MARPQRARRPAPETERSELVRDVLAGLGRTPKAIPCKHFYDARGSALFDRICELPEYYLTRAETAILADRAGEIAELAGSEAVLMELGSGSLNKVRLILDALERPAAYVAIDISGEHLSAAAAQLACDYPGLDVRPVVADFTAPLQLPAIGGGGRRLGFFPGSTIGNFTPAEAGLFLHRTRSMLGPGAHMLVGVDLQKDARLLNAAYNDAAGVTAAFNLNLLARINREADGGFDLGAFAHRAVWNGTEGRMEMHLVARRDQIVTVAGEQVVFAEGETIHTESSYKYTPESFAALARRSGWAVARQWTDADGLFSVWYLRDGG